MTSDLEYTILTFVLWGLLPFLLMGSLAGLLSGLLGIGGGLILVPMLTLAGIGLHQAVGMSLLYILITGFSGALTHFRQGHLKLDLAFFLALGGCIFSYLGTRFSHLLPEAWLSWLFTALVAVIMGLFWKRMRHQESGERKPFRLASGRVIAVLIGSLAGLLSGIFGVGGGFVMTPLLNILLPLSVEESIGTSLAAIVMISAAGAASHFFVGDLFSVLQAQPLAMLFLGGAGALSAPWGARLTRVFSPRQLQAGLFILMGLVAVYMLLFGFHSH
ncbi:hypothetical protein COW36_15615 [bacterium (Candidatus Blackallbacteria) CG17_big_fil_post_rev_8_21_14_2_50_48_46]|uniref:Probable membrane transporter protein n=1 Tax=bacterium (Candidatus Blackallbacteria) CG17_big_fil_post_rev_8_21_14_2_50_48_46 TaxID=2014261 RepID=A0A2M7G388_9BACT|nr:MAG: hypothetical protein COW64_07620 [bacterium (Candidatus Blackallbacteria) CG18_big_fil_WC_8_21_14_2_50_49_26]PIW15896.1 MAG: hypothetical protein COW36_15615 [bacterium (Candidatus Blackallbacteria) CG17_big_fil_post_rev_8_21_14_2_50_48_46]PIW48639.1 MAG: hypothetical protein COW20_08555 [bacterium (Candidatus Blackallbacteria) CG13_big_fil_rev_8_21_14_2_50_49_14]